MEKVEGMEQEEAAVEEAVAVRGDAGNGLPRFPYR